MKIIFKFIRADILSIAYKNALRCMPQNLNND